MDDHQKYINDDDDGQNLLLANHSDWHLAGAFALVAACLTLWGNCLNRLEEFTMGTSYQLMLQKIYREIMMVGLGSFVFTILDQSSLNLTSGFYQAFGFADICCFIMACFFCLQGVLIMVGSLSQARVWHIASNISSEQLHLDVDKMSKTLIWKARYLPFSKTRDAVEFRMLRSIFTSAYTISTVILEFDFGMFLKSTHEDNILSIIEISTWKWCLVILILVVSAVVRPWWHKFCDSYSGCVEGVWGIWAFTLCGVCVLLLAALIFWWGRACELRLFNTIGISNIEDYTAFILSEDDANDTLSAAAAKNGYVRDTIAELMQESKLKQGRENTRKESMQVKIRSMKKKSAQLANTMSFRIKRPAPHDTDDVSTNSAFSLSSIRDEKSAPYSLAPAKIAMEAASSSPDDDSVSAFVYNSPRSYGVSSSYPGQSSMRDVPASPSKSKHKHGVGDDTPSPSAAVRRVALRTFSSAIAENDSEEEEETAVVKSASGLGLDDVGTKSHRKQSSSATTASVYDDGDKLKTDDATRDFLSMTNDTNDMELSDIISYPSSMIAIKEPSKNGPSSHSSSGEESHEGQPKGSPSKKCSLGRGSVDEDVASGTLVSRKRSQVGKLSKNDSGMMWRTSLQNFIKTGVNRFQNSSEEAEKDALKNRLKRNAHKQNFRSIFFFSSPELFFVLINAVMTCSSLYLAWWATRICVLVSHSEKVDTGIYEAFCVSLSALPAILAFPLIAEAIRASSVLKAVTILNLEVVSSVMDKTAVNTAAVEEFRNLFLAQCKAADAKNVKVGMLKLCRRFSSDGMILTQSEFASMLLSCGILCSSQKAKFLFSYIDLNCGSTIDMGVRNLLLLVCIVKSTSNYFDVGIGIFPLYRRPCEGPTSQT